MNLIGCWQAVIGFQGGNGSSSADALQKHMHAQAVSLSGKIRETPIHTIEEIVSDVPVVDPSS